MLAHAAKFLDPSIPHRGKGVNLCYIDKAKAMSMLFGR